MTFATRQPPPRFAAATQVAGTNGHAGPAARPPRPSLARRMWRMTWRLTLVFVIVAILAEIGLRFAGFGSRVQYDASTAVLWQPRPDQTVPNNLTRAPVTIDHRGLRIVPLSGAENEPRHKVLCLGDSVTFGFALSDDQTFEALLQAQLERDSPGQWQLMNAGVNGYNLWLLKQRLIDLLDHGIKPDLLLVSYCFNEYKGWPNEQFSDAEKAAVVKGVSSKNFLRSIGLFNFATEIVNMEGFYKLRNKFMPRGGKGNPKAAIPDEKWLALYRQRVQDLFAEIEKRHLPTITIVWPDKSLDLGDYRRVFIDESRAHGMACANLEPVIKDMDTSEMFFDFEHPRPDTMRLLVDKGLAPFFRAHAPALVARHGS